MRKRRRNQSAAVRFGPALKAFLICLIIGASGVGYVWQKNQLLQLGGELSQREQQLEKIRRQNELFGRTLAALESPRFLESRIAQLKLDLAAPDPNQIVVLPDQWPSPNPAATPLYAVSARPAGMPARTAPPSP